MRVALRSDGDPDLKVTSRSLYDHCQVIANGALAVLQVLPDAGRSLCQAYL